MTPEQLLAIRKRVDAATPGPWEWEPSSGEEPHLVSKGGVNPNRQALRSHYANEVCGTSEWMRITPADAEFTAHAREDIPALLDEVERLTAEVDRTLITLGKVAAHLSPQQMDAIFGRDKAPQPS